MTSCLSGLGSSKAHLKSQAKPHRKQRAGKGAKKKGEQDHRERGRMAVKGASEPEEVTLKSAPNKSEDSSPSYLHQLERQVQIVFKNCAAYQSSSSVQNGLFGLPAFR